MPPSISQAGESPVPTPAGDDPGGGRWRQNVPEAVLARQVDMELRHVGRGTHNRGNDSKPPQKDDWCPGQPLHGLLLPGQLEPGWSSHCFRGEPKAMLSVHSKR